MSEAAVSTQANPLPEWLCHKRVRAAKITAIVCLEPDIIGERELHEAGYRIEHNEPSAPHVFVGHAFIAKHNPQVGGYFVRYEDGYESYSPAAAFEGGYTRVTHE
jgi:hypothetical protein